MDKGYSANVQRRPVHLRRPRAVGLQALRNDPQENTQHHVEHCPVALHEVAQPLRDGEHPLAHWQPGEDVVRQMCRRLQILAKGLADIRLWGVVVALAVELAGTGQLKPGLEVLGYGLVERSPLGVALVVELGFGTRLPARV